MEVKQRRDFIDEIKKNLKFDLQDISTEAKQQITKAISKDIKQEIILDINDSIVDLKADIRTDIGKEIKIVKKDLRNEIGDIKGDFHDNINEIKNDIRKRMKQDSDKIRAQIINEIKQEIVEEIKESIADIKKDVFAQFKHDIPNITEEIKTELYKGVQTQIDKVTIEIKKNTQGEMDKIVKQVMSNIQKEIDNTKERLEFQVTELQAQLEQNIKQVVRSDVNDVLSNSEVTFELDDTTRTRSKRALVMSADEDDCYKLVSLIASSDDSSFDKDNMQLEDGQAYDYIGEIATQNSQIIIGATNRLIVSNIFELDNFVYCIYSEGMLGKFVRQSTIFPEFASVQPSQVNDNNTLGKVLTVKDSQCIYLDKSKKEYSVDEYNNQPKKETHVPKPLTRRSSLVSHNHVTTNNQLHNRTYGVRRTASHHTMNTPPSTRRVTNNIKSVSRQPVTKIEKLDNIEEIPRIYKFVLVKYVR